jgi:cyanophycin synthetase
VEIVNIRVLRGPNVWATFPVLEATLRDVDPGVSLAVCIKRLTGWLPSLAEPLRGVADLPSMLVSVGLHLQSLAGTAVGHGWVAADSHEPRGYQLGLEYKQEELASECLKVAQELCLAAINDRPIDHLKEIDRLRELEYDLRLGGGTGAIVRAAQARDIPTYQLDREYNCLFVLGQGARQHRINASVTDRTGLIADTITQDKELTKTLLRDAGVPVPAGRLVKDAEDAWQAACAIGLPVVVKPRDGELGEGVALKLSTRQEVVSAYAAARAVRKEVLVEKFVLGTHHRLLVVGYRLIAAARRDPAGVIGDGTRTVAELVEEANRDPRRRGGSIAELETILFDEASVAVLEEQGYRPDSVIPAGKWVPVRLNSHISDGGTVADVTDQVHPDVAARSVEAARVLGVDLAGLDVMATDISRPLEEQGGVILEVNTRPGLNVHLERWTGTRRPIGEAIVEHLFPPGQTGRIPIIAVTGSRDTTSTAHQIAKFLNEAGHSVGLVCAEGIYLSGRHIRAREGTSLQATRSVLINPLVETAVLETTPEDIINEGLGFDRCDLAVVTGVENVELLPVVRALVRVVHRTGVAVLPEDVPLGHDCPGSVILFSGSPESGSLFREALVAGVNALPL